MWHAMLYIIGTFLVFSLCVMPAQTQAKRRLAEINMLKTKIAEMEQLKIEVEELKKQICTKCSLVEVHGTVQEIKESLIQYKPGEGVELGPCGIKIQADATYVLQGTPNANNAADGTHKGRCDAAWSSDIYISKAFDDWGLALLHMEPGQGVGAEDQLSLYSNVNRDSNDTGANVPITEIWYEHYLFERQLTLTAGKMDPANYLDQNQYAFNECTQFIARIFRNSPAIEWPDDNTLGGQIVLAPNFMPYLALNATYFNANNSYEDVFSKPFISTELTIKPSQIFGWDDNNWDGNYRFYFWYNGLDHTKLVGQGEPAPDYPKEQNVGYGLSFDQMLTDALGVFVRAGWQRQDITFVSTNPNAAPIEGQWSCGCQFCGKLWHRDDDVLGIAIGQAIPGKPYKDAGNGGAPEGHFEAYYRFKVTSNLYISPDLQYIWNPRGITEDYQGHDGTICVYGVRGQLDF